MFRSMTSLFHNAARPHHVVLLDAETSGRRVERGSLPSTERVLPGVDVFRVPVRRGETPARGTASAPCDGGAPLLLRLQIVDERCRPAPNVVVEIHHRDADFLHDVTLYGRTDGDGVASFATVFPGCRFGGQASVAFRVTAGRGTSMQGDVYLPQAVSDVLAEYVRPYCDAAAGEQGVAALLPSEAYLVQAVIAAEPLCQTAPAASSLRAAGVCAGGWRVSSARG